MKWISKMPVCCLLLYCSYSYAQMSGYDYKRELKGITGSWHKIVVPDDLFQKVSENFDDIRVFGITAGGDTVEAPYLLRLTTGKQASTEASFKMLNESHNNKGYFFTLEMPAIQPVNRITLDFEQRNFDWRIRLDGSQNQDEWFTILNDYRIVSIKNELTDFAFATLRFPESKYRFFRLSVDSPEKPKLLAAYLAQNEASGEIYKSYLVRKLSVKDNTAQKRTEIDVDMQMPVPVSYLQLKVADAFDYYRPVTIQYLADSFKTEQGWKYRYDLLTSGILNSAEKSGFACNSTRAQKLKILVYNQDNPALKIDSVQVKGYVHEVLVRFTEKATYFLVYGNKKAAKPNYDIERFADKSPPAAGLLEIGNEVAIERENPPPANPLFRNKIWLWAVMAVIILVLGWFSMRMIRNK